MDTKPRHFLIFGVVIITLISLACQFISLPFLGAKEQPAGVPIKYGNNGEVISEGDLTFFVSGWENITPDEYNKPKWGKKFIAVEYLILNTGSSPLPVSSYTDFYLMDAGGQKYEYSIDAEVAANIPSVSLGLNPGEKVHGKVGFQVPENATSLQFVGESPFWNISRVFVNLNPEPGFVQPPETLPGEMEQQASQVGETIQTETLAITINGITSSAGNSINTPRPGNKFANVDMTVENKGSANVTLYLQGSMYLKDASGWLYERDIDALLITKGLDTEVKPGETIRWQAGFQVPENASGLVFIFDEDPFTSGGRATVVLP